jgi:hypothetical protein
MKIRMTKTVHGSLDGVTVQELVEGSEYVTVDSPRGERLARHHIKQGVAVAVTAETPEPAPSDPEANLAPGTAPAKSRRRK